MRRLRGGARYGAGAALASDLGGYKFSAFGRALAADAGTPSPVVDGVAFGQPLRWQGRWLDAASGIYDVRNRQWSPELGAFVSPDEFGYATTTGTLWSWPNQNPFLFSDPSGLFGLALGGAASGGLWGPSTGGGAGVYVDVSSSGVEAGSYGSTQGGFGFGLFGGAGWSLSGFTDLASFEGAGIGAQLETGSILGVGLALSTPAAAPLSGGTLTVSGGLGAGLFTGAFGSFTKLAGRTRLWPPIPLHPGAAPAPAPGASPAPPPPPCK
ncbi:MAG: hypothetical protein IPI67_17955 [Myxococcales bacterium]|nr:hypothetical protein [Myxococcales bacterium]